MSKIIDLLSNEYANAYDLEYKSQFSAPKIYDANGDISKRWYVYYSSRNPENDKLERQTPIYAGVNRFKNLRERKNAIKILAQAVDFFYISDIYHLNFYYNMYFCNINSI